jgi:hypothetical protein
MAKTGEEEVCVVPASPVSGSPRNAALTKRRSAVGAALAGAATGAVVSGPIGAVIVGSTTGIVAATNNRKAGHLAREIGEYAMTGVDNASKAGKCVARKLPARATLRRAASAALMRVQHWDKKLRVSSTIHSAAMHGVSYIVDRPDEAFLSSQRGWFCLELAGTCLRLDVKNEQLRRGAGIIVWPPDDDESEKGPARHQSRCLVIAHLANLWVW